MARSGGEEGAKCLAVDAERLEGVVVIAYDSDIPLPTPTLMYLVCFAHNATPTVPLSMLLFSAEKPSLSRSAGADYLLWEGS